MFFPLLLLLLLSFYLYYYRWVATVQIDKYMKQYSLAINCNCMIARNKNKETKNKCELSHIHISKHIRRPLVSNLQSFILERDLTSLPSLEANRKLQVAQRRLQDHQSLRERNIFLPHRPYTTPQAVSSAPCIR